MDIFHESLSDCFLFFLFLLPRFQLALQKQKEGEDRLKKAEDEAQKKWQEEEDARLEEERKKEEIKQKKKDKEKVCLTPSKLQASKRRKRKGPRFHTLPTVFL